MALSSRERIDCRVAVAGGGCAGLSAALAAAESGADVVVLEKAPEEERGGNTRFSDAQMRFPHRADSYWPRSYSVDEMRGDLLRISGGRANQELIEVLARESAGAVEWLSGLGLEWEEGFPHARGYRRHPRGGGAALLEALYAEAERRGVRVLYETAMREVLSDSGGRTMGVRAEGPTGPVEIAAGATVLACGGFQANAEMRLEHLGRPAETAVLRGSRHDTGEGITTALAAGAQPAGDWAGYHAAVIDARSAAVECGMTAVYNFQMGIIVDGEGRRFLDEGEDFRDHTYAKFGREVIEKAAGKAFCIFDQQTYPRPEFQLAWRPVGPPFEADTLGGLAEQLGVSEKGLARTVGEFNAAVAPGEADFDRLDGKGTRGISPAKSNWALPLVEPPFVGLPVTGGITFTFGGVKTDAEARVIDRSGGAIAGLYAAGEMVGGFYYGNYPGATSVLRGVVFGRIAGAKAARG